MRSVEAERTLRHWDDPTRTMSDRWGEGWNTGGGLRRAVGIISYDRNVDVCVAEGVAGAVGASRVGMFVHAYVPIFYLTDYVRNATKSVLQELRCSSR